MNELADRADALHRQGHNCAQSVLLSFCEKYGLDPALADAMACGLGGGARCGELCGALSGGVLVVGLKKGAEGREPCAVEVRKLIAAFRGREPSLRCAELLGPLYVPQTPEERAARMDQCCGYIRLVAETLAQLGC